MSTAAVALRSAHRVFFGRASLARAGQRAERRGDGKQDAEMLQNDQGDDAGGDRSRGRADLRNPDGDGDADSYASGGEQPETNVDAMDGSASARPRAKPIC